MRLLVYPLFIYLIYYRFKNYGSFFNGHSYKINLSEQSFLLIDRNFLSHFIGNIGLLYGFDALNFFGITLGFILFISEFKLVSK